MTMFSMLHFYDPRVHVSQMWHHYHMVLGIDFYFFWLLVWFKMESITEFSCCTSTVCVCHQTLVSTCDAVLWCKTHCILRNKIIKYVCFPPTILTVLLMSSWNYVAFFISSPLVFFWSYAVYIKRKLLEISLTPEETHCMWPWAKLNMIRWHNSSLC